MLFRSIVPIAAFVLSSTAAVAQPGAPDWTHAQRVSVNLSNF